MSIKFGQSDYALDPKTVKKRLIDLTMSQRELIVQCEISTATIIRYINGSGRNLFVQKEIARCLKVPLEALWDIPDEPRPAA
jgi:hypothetical protein